MLTLSPPESGFFTCNSTLNATLDNRDQYLCAVAQSLDYPKAVFYRYLHVIQFSKCHKCPWIIFRGQSNSGEMSGRGSSRPYGEWELQIEAYLISTLTKHSTRLTPKSRICQMSLLVVDPDCRTQSNYLHSSGSTDRVFYRVRNGHLKTR